MPPASEVARALARLLEARADEFDQSSYAAELAAFMAVQVRILEGPLEPGEDDDGMSWADRTSRTVVAAMPVPIAPAAAGFKVREILPDGQVALWATMGHEPSVPRDDDGVDAARFADLAAVDAALESELRQLLVDVFLLTAGLAAEHRDEALAQAAIEVGTTPKGSAGCVSGCRSDRASRR